MKKKDLFSIAIFFIIRITATGQHYFCSPLPDYCPLPLGSNWHERETLEPLGKLQLVFVACRGDRTKSTGGGY